MVPQTTRLPDFTVKFAHRLAYQECNIKHECSNIPNLIKKLSDYFFSSGGVTE